jgi:D-arabinose 1-dehydrogenase-like Zn-dependent alcohol dehydrogenase
MEDLNKSEIRDSNPKTGKFYLLVRRSLCRKETMNTQISARSGISRRRFLYYSVLAASATAAYTGYSKAKPRKLNPGDKLRIASVGGGGKGGSDIEYCAGEEIVAIADVDQSKAAGSLKRCPNAKFYFDWREMLEKEGKNIDAVTVSTPDHLHALVASTAIKMGKHVYCQKPLTQTVYEARHLRNLAKEYGVVTQMGNQGSSESGLRRAVEVVHSGLIGPVRQIHVWSNRPIWPQGVGRPGSNSQ